MIPMDPPLAALPTVFTHLPDGARLWAFGVSRPLRGDEEARLLGVVDRFLEAWKAHGYPLAAAREWLYGRFLLVGVDDKVVPPSGCSIDALMHALGGVERELDLEILGGAPIWFRDPASGADPRRISRAEFKEKAARGEVTGATVVFDLAIATVGELRAGKWELPVARSWHRRML